MTAPTAWRPIGTAPRDGRSIMLWIANDENGPHCFAPVSITSDRHWWDDATGDQIEPIKAATHWMPLPAPPHPAGGGRGVSDLPTVEGGFGCILADPPWRFKTWSPKRMDRSPDGRKPRPGEPWQTFRNRQIQTTPENHYPTMAHDEMCALPIGAVAAKNSVLILWVVDSMIHEALQVGAAWGFKFKTAVFVWAKGREGFSPHPSLGYWSRKQSEQAFLFTKGSPRRLCKGVEQMIFCPRGAHSAKPDIQYERIEALVGGPYLELFARSKRPGWSAWGNQVGIRDGLFAE